MNENKQTSFQNDEADEGTLVKNISIHKGKVKQQDRHRQVKCQTCFREMRADNLKIHLKKQSKLVSLQEQEIREEFIRRKKMKERRHERNEMIKKIAEEESIPLECFNKNELEHESLLAVKQELVDDELLFKRKIQRGKLICGTIYN
jgi:hypothetical protein